MRSLATLRHMPLWVYDKYGIRTRYELMRAACVHANQSKMSIGGAGKGLEKAAKTAEWFSDQLAMLVRNKGKTRKTKPVFSRFS
ncbi:hypothetical protein [Endozoicomonas ascidiicola]|uniref:hypothetical protein n=1 Tax=Endozoicomonas ascidiicola TaxID=1698521 RepID=UPI000836B81F|nr:hypothetical protein [Endozoicomonas ascidiicola]